ncbi:MAG: phosphoadenosine phosphosulfate reductase family protein, partial [Pyrinomonadaceae bacterium]
MNLILESTIAEASDADLQNISSSFVDRSPEELLKWSLDQFGRDVALATGFGAEGCVLIHMLASVDKTARFFFLDTDLLFPET